MPVPADMICTSPGRITEPVPMLSLCSSAPFQNVGNDLHVLVPVGVESGAGADPILIDHAQRAEAHLFRIVVIAEREGVAAVQPSEIGGSPLRGGPHGDHGTLRTATSYFGRQWCRGIDWADLTRGRPAHRPPAWTRTGTRRAARPRRSMFPAGLRSQHRRARNMDRRGRAARLVPVRVHAGGR